MSSTRRMTRRSRATTRSAAAVMALALFAASCGSDDGDGDGDGETAEEPAAEPEGEADTDGEQADGEAAAGDDCDGFPSRPIEIIVPYTAGGGTDQVGQLFAQKASEYDEVQWRHQSMPGAGAALGSKFVVDSEPDGHTLTFGTSASIVSVGMLEDAGYTHEDFEPVATVTAPSFVFVVAPDSPYETWQELLEYSQENPGAITYGVSGAGGSPGILVAGLQKMLDFEWTLVPFDGSAAAVLAAAAGDVDLSVPSLGSALDVIDAGTVRPLVQTNSTRSDGLPDTPTFMEEGTDFEFTIWRSIGAPVGTPDCAIQHLADIAEQVSEDAEWQELSANIEGEPSIFRGPEESKELWNEYEAFLEPLVDELRPE